MCQTLRHFVELYFATCWGKQTLQIQKYIIVLYENIVYTANYGWDSEVYTRLASGNIGTPLALWIFKLFGAYHLQKETTGNK